MTWSKYVSKVERQVIGVVIKDALAAGCLIEVFDGEEVAVRSDKADEIKAEIGATDETTLRFYRRRSPDGEHGIYVGWVWFIHGNGVDVLSDYSANSETEALLKGAIEVADKLQS